MLSFCLKDITSSFKLRMLLRNSACPGLPLPVLDPFHMAARWRDVAQTSWPPNTKGLIQQIMKKILLKVSCSHFLACLPKPPGLSLAASWLRTVRVALTGGCAGHLSGLGAYDLLRSLKVLSVVLLGRDWQPSRLSSKSCKSLPEPATGCPIFRYLARFSMFS